MIRTFRKGDEKEWCDVRAENLTRINSENYPQEIIRLLLSSNSPEKVLKQSSKDYLIVFEEEGRIVGTGRLTGKGEVENMFVKPEKHRSGIGTMILEKLEEKAVEQGLQKIFLYSSVTGEKFYQKNGYRKIEEVWEEAGGEPYKVTLMEKKIMNTS